MSERAQALSERFTEADRQLISLVEGASAQGWKATCKGETWPVNVTAHHVAGSYARQRGWLESAIKGQPLQRSAGGPDEGNAQHAREYADVTREETLGMLRRDGAALAAAIAALTDAELDLPVQFRREGPPWTVEQLVERVVIGHPLGHGASIREALGS